MQGAGLWHVAPLIQIRMPAGIVMRDPNSRLATRLAVESKQAFNQKSSYIISIFTYLYQRNPFTVLSVTRQTFVYSASQS